VSLDHVRREQLPEGQTLIQAGQGSFVFRRLQPGALLVTISGHDTGQFGTHTLDEIRKEIQRHAPPELFVDARDAVAVAPSVSQEWTRFFSVNRAQLTRVRVLVSSRLVSLTVAIAQHLSRTGNLIQIYTEPETFDTRLAGLAR